MASRSNLSKLLFTSSSQSSPIRQSAFVIIKNPRSQGDTRKADTVSKRSSTCNILSLRCFPPATFPVAVAGTKLDSMRMFETRHGVAYGQAANPASRDACEERRRHLRPQTQHCKPDRCTGRRLFPTHDTDMKTTSRCCWWSYKASDSSIRRPIDEGWRSGRRWVILSFILASFSTRTLRALGLFLLSLASYYPFLCSGRSIPYIP
ncbi:hypothetical protein R3P38DRAFT_1734105 [Favolaschia claudopus]|uniref:Uncharacterized protein n=1 Tax=Favolaschia claudopus TaxID=2862362 RepID=A0AAW0A988_9AGAR